MPKFLPQDQDLMAKAIELAQKGRFSTSPNPNVGCVLATADGEIKGQGFHLQAGQGHAEVNALASLNGNSEGLTAYVTLEPCSHYGRTPPCAEALIKAGIKRVVVANRDPNPLVAGRGVSMLEQAGISVLTGLLASEACELNRGFFWRMQHQRPWVTLKLAASLDGKTALANGQSKWITGPTARKDVQVHRAQSCAILTGSGTVLADNPSLNIRPDDWPSSLPLPDIQGSIRQPLKIVIDSKNQLSSDATIFQSGRTLIANFAQTQQNFSSAVAQWHSPNNNGYIDLLALLHHLGSLELNSVWVEAGANLAGALMELGLVDELILYQAPKIMGHTGRDLLNVSPFTTMQEVLTFKWRETKQIGDDMKYTALLSEPACP